MPFLLDAVVYVVDAADSKRFAESKKELDALFFEESLRNVPFLILGNKIDNPKAASEAEFREHIGVFNYTTGKGKVNRAGSNMRPIEVFMCSIASKKGYGEGFRCGFISTSTRKQNNLVPNGSDEVDM